MLLDVVATGTEWMEQAACRDSDPEIFFDNPARAKAFCAGCPVVAQCRQLGESEAFGVFGGVDPIERATERREREGDTREAREAADREARRLYLAGQSFASIAAQLPGMTEHKVRDAILSDATTGALARKARAERSAVNAAKAAEIRQLMSEGYGAYAIIKATGYNKATVYRLFQKAGRPTAA